MKLISMTPFIAVIVLGFAVFTSHPSSVHGNDLAEWKSNQQILLLIENCQSGILHSETCKSRIPTILDECKSFHVLACDDKRLVNLAYPDQFKDKIN